MDAQSNVLTKFQALVTIHKKQIDESIVSVLLGYNKTIKLISQTTGLIS